MSDQKDWYDLAVEEAKREKLPEGALSCSGGYVWWKPAKRDIELDGEFSARELRRFASHMDRHTELARKEHVRRVLAGETER